MEGKYLYLCNNQIERILCQDDRSLTNERPYIFCVQPMTIGGAYADIAFQLLTTQWFSLPLD